MKEAIAQRIRMKRFELDMLIIYVSHYSSMVRRLG